MTHRALNRVDYVDTDSHNTFGATKDISIAGPRDRPADKFEITPEMSRAGRRALEKFYLGDGIYDLRESCLAAVFRAMMASRP